MIRPRGLPIGNLSSQLFANYYLSGIDHYIREELGFPAYIRYMDDMIVFGNDNDELKHARVVILNQLAQLRLKLNPGKDFVQANSKGVDFLGFRLYGKQIRIRSQNLCRFRRKLKRISKGGSVELTVLLRSYNGHLGFLLGGHTKSVTNHVLRDIEFHDEQKRWKLIV